MAASWRSKRNLGSILFGSAELRPHHVALRLNERALTYAELERAARGVATSLRQRGLEPGDRVALLVPNVPEFSVAYFGILYAGCTVVPLNVLLAGPEVTYHLKDSGAKLLIAHPLFEAPAREGAGELGVQPFPNAFWKQRNRLSFSSWRRSPSGSPRYAWRMSA